MACQTQEPIHVCMYVSMFSATPSNLHQDQPTLIRRQQQQQHLYLFQNLEIKNLTHNPQVAKLFEAGCVKKITY